MLTHKIIVSKPTETTSNVVLLPHLSNAAANSGWNYAARNLKNQRQLDEYLAGTGFSVNDFMTLNPGEVTTLHHVHRIIDIQTDYSKLEFSHGNAQAQPYRFLGMKPPNSDSDNTWDRWDTHNGYRSLRQHEFEKVVLPHLDYLQDYCKKHLSNSSK